MATFDVDESQTTLAPILGIGFVPTSRSFSNLLDSIIMSFINFKLI